jgi:nucleotide-binding universal stress UspA family protein
VNLVQNILAAVDNSPFTAVVAEYASDLARACDGRVLATYVVDSRLVESTFARLVGEEFLDTSRGEASDALAQMLAAHGRTALELVASVCQRKGVGCEQRIERGRPAQVLASLAPLYDLLVIGSYGAEARFRTSLLGSTAAEVVRLATRPLVVVRQEYRPVSRVLVGYEASPEATRALETIIKLGQRAGWSVTIAIVSDDGAAGQSLAGQARLFRGLEQLSYEVVVRRGEPPYVLLELASTGGADLIAVGSRGLRKLASILLGSTADILLRQAPVPVAVFR